MARRGLWWIVAVCALVPAARRAEALCNIIPPAESTFPSTVGNVTSPIAAPGDPVTLKLSGCETGTGTNPGFNATAGANQITITFMPPEGTPTDVVVAGPRSVECVGPGGLCLALTFAIPATAAVLPPDGLTGPARITVVNTAPAGGGGAVIVAQIDDLFTPHPTGSTCDKEPEPVFRTFTVLPPANDFAALTTCTPACQQTRVLATVDGSGALLIPFDYTDVLPQGPGAPVARLLSGTTTVDAFAKVPGMQLITVPSPSFVRSFTIDGRPVPPLLRTADAGREVFGAADGARGIIRVARTDGRGGDPIFELGDRLTNGGRGPIVFTTGEYTVAKKEAIPLDNLRSTAQGVAYARDEAIEGNLNGDPDTADDVVQLVDVASFTSTNTGMAASPTNNPIVGGNAVDTAGDLAVFLESEAQQGATDLTGDGDANDDVLRVFTLLGVQMTGPPLRRGSPFPGIDRRPLAVDDGLVYYREPQVGLARVGFLSFLNASAMNDLAVTPDGRMFFLSYGGVGLNGTQLHRRDGETGGGVREEGFGFGISPLGAMTAGVAVSPDGQVAFSTETATDTLRSFEIRYFPNGAEFNVSPLGFDVETNAVGGVSGIDGVTGVAVAPTGARVYTVAAGSDAVSFFSYTPAANLTYLGTMANCPFTICLSIPPTVYVRNLVDPSAVVVSPSGSHVYVTAFGSNAVRVFTNNIFGALSDSATYADGGTGGDQLAGPRDLAMSPDGRHVYVAAEVDGAVTVFTRNTTTGVLAFAGAVPVSQAATVAASPDGQAVYVASLDRNVYVFTRNDATGLLTLIEVLPTGIGAPPTKLSLTVSPDAEHVYLASGIASTVLYERRQLLRAFDATGQGRSGPPASQAARAAVAADRAALIAPGTHVLSVYDAVADTLATPAAAGLPANRVGMSSTLIALGIPEASLGVDVNGDGHMADDVLSLLDPADPTAAPTPTESVMRGPVTVTDVCRGGTTPGTPCRSDADCPNGLCRAFAVTVGFGNSNGLTFYDAADGSLGAVERPMLDFVVSGRWVAFRVTENGDDPLPSLNGDSDGTDRVMFVYDLVAGQEINVGQAVTSCELPGCEPGLPYKIRDDVLYYVTEEADQGDGGTDLDGDGSTDDFVVQLFDLRTARQDVLPIPAGAPTLPPLPVDFLDATIVFQQKHEADVGQDVNQDGDMDDVVVFVDGDSDGDGVLDSQDICVEASNRSQADTDTDGLGDRCDPTPTCQPLVPGAPLVAPATAEKCQEALGKASRKLQQAYGKAVDACLDAIAKGKLAGAPTPLCRGGAGPTTLALPADPKTAEKLQKEIDKLGTSIGKGCPTGLPLLDACGATPAAATTCIARTVAAATIARSIGGYGDVRALAEKPARKCQKAIGKSSLKYVTTATKSMQQCLDRRNAGDVAGNGQVVCLGSETSTGLVAPSDTKTAEHLAKAGEKLAKMLASGCPDTTAAALDACGHDATSLASCLACGEFAHAVEVVRATYGPN